ncbi:PTS fructose transporter subunit IIABC [Mesoplasma seiffertii]|uniref:PTS fructose transporter subunit IIABC n=1 Tax=Mesoplasma seiffertii TaxID=28224 RepID=UPI000687DE35|nr:fructose-specific PTS transporter subunit EIIC [Mesoplasma seiffertii]
MELKNLFKAKAAFFNQDLKSKAEVIDFLTQQLADKKIISDQAEFKKLILKRESEDSTGIGDGIGLPHAITGVVKEPTIAFMSLQNPIEWGSLDGKPVDLIFMIATNDEGGGDHLAALSQLSTFLMKAELQANFRKAKTFPTFVKNFNVEETSKTNAKSENGFYDVIGITACPTGIAHTYMSAEKLTEYAQELGMTVKIETQGRRGTEDKLSQDEVDNAKVIILAHDKAIQGMGRFAGKKVIDTSTKDAIYNGKELITNFEAKAVEAKGGSNNDEETGEFSLKKFKDFKGNVLAGVSRMLPFVVAGGIILGIGFLIDFIAGNSGIKGQEGLFGTINPVAGWFSAIGKTSMMMMVPIMAGYIAYTIVGPQGLMPGLVAGLLADGTGGFVYGNDKGVGGWTSMWSKLFPKEIPMTSGFIGGIAGAFIAAIIVFGLTKGFSKFTKGFQGVRDIVLIPLLSLLFTAFAMFVVNIPLGYTMYGIQQGLQWMATHNLLILLGAIIGLMMCVDMGGPINKIAYVLGTMSVGGNLGNDPMITNIMAASMAAGMIPPLGIALSTVIFRRAWTAKERDAAKANWLMGAFFITEGAIPFMISDFKRVSASAMLGGTVTGLLVGAFQITLKAPHGGIAVFPLLDSELFNSPGMIKGMGITLYILSVLIGVIIMALVLGFWKSADMKKGKLVVESGLVAKTNKKVAATA